MGLGRERRRKGNFFSLSAPLSSSSSLRLFRLCFASSWSFSFLYFRSHLYHSQVFPWQTRWRKLLNRLECGDKKVKFSFAPTVPKKVRESKCFYTVVYIFSGTIHSFQYTGCKKKTNASCLGTMLNISKYCPSREIPIKTFVRTLLLASLCVPSSTQRFGGRGDGESPGKSRGCIPPYGIFVIQPCLAMESCK